MMAKVQKWGNSLAVRIPKSLAQEVRVEEGTRVDLTANALGMLVLRPRRRRRRKYTLEELLAKVTPENIHPEIDFGPPVGREVW